MTIFRGTFENPKFPRPTASEPGYNESLDYSRLLLSRNKWRLPLPSSKSTDLLWLVCTRVFHLLWDCPWWYKYQAALLDILLPRRLRSLRYWDHIDWRHHISRVTRTGNQGPGDAAFFSSQLSPSNWMNPAWWNWPTKISPNKHHTWCQKSLAMTRLVPFIIALLIGRVY